MKWYKKLALVLAAVMCCGTVAACKDPSDPNNPNNPDDPGNQGGNTTVTTPKETVTEPAEHFATNVLHKVRVQETSNPFVTDEATEYCIVTASGTEDNKAASFIQSNLKAATGAVFALIRYDDDVEWSADKKYIVLNVPELFESAGLTMPSEDLGQTGYYIKNAGKSVFIATKSGMGSQYGAIAFLRHVVGYEMYAYDTVAYEKSGATLPDMEIIERPDFEFYVQGNRVTAEATYGMGFLGRRDVA